MAVWRNRRDRVGDIATESIYEAARVKVDVPGLWGRIFRTFPSPSASVEPAHHSRRPSGGFFHTFPEPQAEGDPFPAMKIASGGRRDVERSSIYSGSAARSCCGGDFAVGRRPRKNQYDGCRHSRLRASPMGPRSCSASGSSAKSSRLRPHSTHDRFIQGSAVSITSNFLSSKPATGGRPAHVEPSTP